MLDSTTTVTKRTCKNCGKEKPVEDNFRPNGKICFQCQRDKHNAWEKEKYQADQARRLERLEYAKKYYALNKSRIQARQKVYRENHNEYPTKNTEYSREYRARLKKDAKAYAEYLRKNREDQRFRRREQWEREGKELELVSVERYKRYNRTPYIHFENGPIREVMQEWLLTGSQAELARLSGIPERRIYDILHTKHTSRQETVDALCLAMDTTLNLVYENALTDGNRPTAEVSA